MENPTLPGVYVLLRAASLLPAKGAVNTPEAISLLLHASISGGVPAPVPPGTWLGLEVCWHTEGLSPRARKAPRPGLRGGDERWRGRVLPHRLCVLLGL